MDLTTYERLCRSVAQHSPDWYRAVYAAGPDASPKIGPAHWEVFAMVARDFGFLTHEEARCAANAASVALYIANAS